MFANPTVQRFIDEIIGGPTPISRPPPQAVGSNTSLARALARDVTLPRIGGQLSVPAIQPGRGPIAPLPSVGVNRGVGSQEQQNVPNNARSIGMDSSALTSGLGNLGTGINTALQQYAVNRAQQQANADALNGAVARPGALPGAAPRPPPFGTPAAALPSFAQPGIGAGPVGSSIGGVSGLPQFLNGLKAGEGVPYSGQSPTGAIGAYGLTGGFIKQYAPSAGLPTDRASYMNNPDLQDQLAAHAATQMYNQYGSWPSVANAWLTGSPTATTSAPGNMSPAAYVAKVMRAAGMSGADQLQDQQQDAGDSLAPRASAPPSQSVIPGQQNPHLPGFDPSSVPFTNTPIGQQQSMAQPPTGMAPPNPLAAALAQSDPNAPPMMAPGIISALNNPLIFGGGQFGNG